MICGFVFRVVVSVFFCCYCYFFSIAKIVFAVIILPFFVVKIFKMKRNKQNNNKKNNKKTTKNKQLKQKNSTDGSASRKFKIS